MLDTMLAMVADDLPTTPLDQVHWSFVNIWRFLTVGMICVLVFQFAIMLSHYWWRLMPLRKEIALSSATRRSGVVAPPVGWTFAYHVTIGLILVTLGVGMTQSALANNHPTVATYTSPLLLFALSVILSQFVKFYSRSLQNAYYATVIGTSGRPVEGTDPTKEGVKGDS